MTTSTLEAMRTATARRAAADADAFTARVRQALAEHDHGQHDDHGDRGRRARPTSDDRHAAHHRPHVDGAIETGDGITIIPDVADAPGSSLAAGAHERPAADGAHRYPPMNLHSLPEGLTRSLRLFSLFRREQDDPDTFYRFLAADTVRHLLAFTPLAGARAVDVGGGPGYTAEALNDQQATCHVVEVDADELRRGVASDGCSQGDALDLPIASGSLDLVHSSNVLEHVPDAEAMLGELVRVLKPGSGVGYVAFTNWLSPWGGHETSPWHYLGGRRAADRYRRRTGRDPKNHVGHTLHPVHIGEVLAWFEGHDDVEVLWAGPRYLPEWARPVLRVPGVRELATWNLAVVFRRRATH